MKIRMIIITVLTIGLANSVASAQLFRGGLLRRIFSGPEAAEPSKDDKSSEQAAKAKKEKAAVEKLRASGDEAAQKSDAKRATKKLRQPVPTPAEPPTVSSPDVPNVPAPDVPTEPEPTDLQLMGMDFVAAGDQDKIMVASVQKDGDGDRAGARKGDQLVSLGGFEATSLSELKGFEEVLNPGDRLVLVVKRANETVSLDVVYRHAEAPELETDAAIEPEVPSEPVPSVGAAEPLGLLPVLDAVDIDQLGTDSDGDLRETIRKQEETIRNLEVQLEQLQTKLNEKREADEFSLLIP